MPTLNAKPRIYPDWEAIKKLPTKLTAGELHLANFLYNHLPSSYTIYVQPVVNGLKPDIVIADPNWGVIIFEVKDWTLGRYRREGDRLIGQTNGEPWMERHPMKQANHYTKEIFRQFISVDEATREVGDESNDFRVCLPVIYIHGPAGREVEQLFDEYAFGAGASNLVLHRENLNIENAVPWVRYPMTRSRYLSTAQSEAITDLHRWLQPIANQADGAVPKKLTGHQESLAKPQKGYFRVRGVAGSGKSLVLARRAARASREGKVVVTCYNITMAHVLRDLIAKCGEEVDWRNVTVRHLHGLIRDIAAEAGPADPYGEDGFEKTMALLRGGEIQDVNGSYRGIYVDEGQDFEATWVDALASMRAEDGELVFMADYRQGLYERPSAADGRRLHIAKFEPGWKQLNKTYRLPWRVAFFLNELAAAAQLGDEHDPSLSDFEDRPSQESLLEELTWTNVNSLEEALTAINRILSQSSAQPSDIAILVRTHERGYEVVRSAELADQRFSPIQHIFGPDADSEESKRRKHAFWMGRGNLKACTVHSFKGWELNHVIVLWDGTAIQRGDLSALYVALSRAYFSLHVLNLNRSFDRFNDLDVFKF